MRLSEAQKRVLSVMVEHNTTITTVHGRGESRAFFSGLLGKPGGYDVRISTIHVLLRRGLIRSIGDPALYWRGKYEITHAGRAALEPL